MSRLGSRALHLAFELGVSLKGLNGVVELLGAAIPLLVSPDQLVQAARHLTRRHLAQDPHAFLASHLLRAAEGLSAGDVRFASLYLLTHGVVKVLLVWALFRRRLWAYPLAMVVFALFGVYQGHLWLQSRSAAMLLLTVLDVLVILLTAVEYRRLRANPGEGPAVARPPPDVRAPAPAGPDRSP